MFWSVGAEFVMGGIVEVGSAVCACAVWRDGCEECLDACGLGCGR
jgi:hypothetical protein